MYISTNIIVENNSFNYGLKRLLPKHTTKVVAAEDMNMKMRHLLASITAVIRQDSITRFNNPRIARNSADRPKKLQNFFVFSFSRKVLKRHIRPFRNNQKMFWGLGMNIFKSKCKIILKYLIT